MGRSRNFSLEGSKPTLIVQPVDNYPFLAITHYFLVNMRPIRDIKTSFNALSH